MKKTLALLLAILSIGTALASCSSSGDNGGTADTTADNADTTVAGDETTGELTDEELLSQYVATLDGDYDGYEFRILSRSEADNPYWWARDIAVEAENGEPINDAIYERNRLLNETLNVTIVNKPVKTPYTEANTLITAGETDAFDIVTDGINQLSANLATAGYLIDYNELSGVKLDNVWWDQRMNSDMSIANKLYTITGDISIMDNEGTWQVIFNKDFQEQYSLSDYYAHRDAGTWTMDVMLADAIATSRDTDGDGTMDGNIDQFGLASEPFNAYALYAGSGELIATKNDDDLPEYTLYSERADSVINKALDLNANKDIFVNHNNVNNVFSTGRVMFQIVGMRTLPVMRQIETEFGILPIPKYEESQDRYYSIGSNSNLTAYSMPVTLSDPERTAEILEALAGVSYYTLTPAYYDITLEGKFLRDEESKESIDIILANRSYDLGIVYNWGSALTLFTDMSNTGDRDFASKCATIEPTIIAKIDEFIETIS